MLPTHKDYKEKDAIAFAALALPLPTKIFGPILNT
jgi:hypothetical protein